MQPDQEHHPDYNFIMNPTKPPKKGLVAGGDKKQRLLIGIIGGSLLLITIVIFISVLLGGSGSNTEKLVGIAQQQTELVRVATLGEKDATDVSAKNLASTVKLSLTSAKNETVALISKQDRQLEPKDLIAKQNANTDKALTAAKQANSFDETFTSTLQSGLTVYQQELTELFNATDAADEKALLQKLYAQSKILSAIQ